MKRPEGLPEQGMYEDVDFGVYRSWPAASNSGLGVLKRSALHFNHDREHGSKDTPAKKQGRVIHTLVLEPEMFGETIRAAGQCSFLTNDGRDRCQSQGKYLLTDNRSACGTHVKTIRNDKRVSVDETLEVIGPKDAAEANGCSNAVWKHPAAAALLGSEGPNEVSLVWQDPVSGVWCKGRVDKWSFEYRSIVDYKTTDDASEESFERSCWKFGYYRQGAFYIRGYDVLQLPVDQLVIIAQEKPEPHAVATYGYPRISGPLQLGDDYIDPLLKIYKHHSQTNVWPGYSQRVEEGHLPHYAWRQADDEINKLKEIARNL